VAADGAPADLVQEHPPARLHAALRARVAEYVRARPNWDGVVILGDARVHHWVHVSAGEAISMMGFLTPALLADLGGSATPDMAALSDTLSRPERMAAGLRAAQVAGDAAVLSGHLIGAELAAAKMYWLGQEVVALDPGPYANALRAQGVSVVEA
ncbi:MAG: 2-dehydro-3-deoxygalactonokinase, partial [Pseudomonadota bacterium]